MEEKAEVKTGRKGNGEEEKGRKKGTEKRWKGKIRKVRFKTWNKGKGKEGRGGEKKNGGWGKGEMGERQGEKTD